MFYVYIVMNAFFKYHYKYFNIHTNLTLLNIKRKENTILT